MSFYEFFFLVAAILSAIDWVTLIIVTVVAMIVNYHLSEIAANRRSKLLVTELVTIIAVLAIAYREMAVCVSRLQPTYVSSRETLCSIVLGVLIFSSMMLIYNAGVRGHNAEARRQRRQANAIMRAKILGDIQDVENFFNNLEESVKNAETGNYILTSDGKLYPSH